jgi:hypothetical protein
MEEKPFEKFGYGLPPYSVPGVLHGLERALEQCRLPSSLLDQITKGNDLSHLISKGIPDILRTDKIAAELASKGALDIFRSNNSIASQLVPKGVPDILRTDKIAAQILGTSRLFSDSILTAQFDALKIADTSTVLSDTVTKLGLKFQEINLLSARADFASRLLEPSNAYTRFADRTCRRIERSENKKVSRALELSLELAENQLKSTNDNLTEVVTVPEDGEFISPVRNLLLPVTQQNELVSLVQRHEEYDDKALIEHSITAKNADDARLILHLINRCNELALFMGTTEIFKPTTRLMEVYADLPWLVVRSKSELAGFVDCLYFVFYEGAGKDKLRFLEQHGGVLDTTSCSFIWSIKSLRNKWLSHDINHGKESEIRKSWSTLREALEEIGFKRIPATDKEFSRLHQRLLAEALGFLNRLHEKLCDGNFELKS